MSVAIVDNDQFEWTGGEEYITCWEKPGHDWHTFFCKKCGSPLPGPNDPQRMYLPVGVITAGHENLRVAHHIHVASKASWDEIGDAGKQHDKGFGE